MKVNFLASLLVKGSHVLIDSIEDKIYHNIHNHLKMKITDVSFQVRIVCSFR